MTWRKSTSMFADREVKNEYRNRSRFLDELVKKKRGSNGGSRERTTTRSASRKSEPRTHGMRYSTSAGASEPRFDSRDRSRSLHSAARTSEPQFGSRDRSRSLHSAARTSETRRKSPPPLGSRDTTSVYAKSVSQQSERQPRQVKPRSAAPKASHSLSSTSNPSSLDRTREQSSRSRSPTAPRRNDDRGSFQQSRNARDKSLLVGKKLEQPTFDSTLFFPVGSLVIHRQMGKGSVLEPPAPTADVDLPVLVEFASGQRQVYCARGSDLSRVF